MPVQDTKAEVAGVPVVLLVSSFITYNISHPCLTMPHELEEHGLFIGDLDTRVSCSDVVRAFREPMPAAGGKFNTVKPFRSVTRATIARNFSTGISRGFGFVFFSDKEEMVRALNEMHGMCILARPSA